MDKMLESHNNDSIKKMMLMHEEIFKQQVKELHRLYNLQKKLMHELKTEVLRRRAPLTETVTNNSKFAIWHQPVTNIQNHVHHAHSVRSNDSKEQSGSFLGPESSRMPMKLDLADQEGTPSIDLRKFGKERELEIIDKETGDVELELTLCIGRYQRKNRLQSSSPIKKYVLPSSSITDSSA
ncbi:unnamed protein product [Fraxinus pennsylvanica]|uniref:Uncharacterized protein n=1 Tax=Fraxinus pennsylvanica TaxID=56036 RepID=A0AAD2DRJ5_9LAMI|nr:unnamed protein product [Fraxinus pennsylvanica]